MKLSTQILINASAEKVWNVFTDFSAYPEWNPFIQSLSGDFIPGGRLKVRISDIALRPKVITLFKNRELTWLGHLGFPGLFDGKHTFKFVPQSDDQTIFMQYETFSGILIPLLKKKLMETEQMFHKMNVALKEQVETQITG